MTDYIITGNAVEKWDVPHAILAEEVVRCRDCAFSRVYKFEHGRQRYVWSCEAEWCADQEGGHPSVEPDGFCAWGERKGE